MIFRRHDEPGTPVYGRPHDEDADTGAPEQGGFASPGARSSAADPAHDVRTDPGPDAPDWSGARHETAAGSAPDHGTAPERDAVPDGPALDHDTQPDQFGGSRPEHTDRLVAGRREADDVPGPTPGSTPGSTDTTPDTTGGTDDLTDDTTRDTTGGTGHADDPTERDGAFPDSPEAEGHSPAGRHVAEDPADTGLLGWDADEVRRRWHDVQVAFVDDPRESVERADAMVDEVVSALSSRRRELMDNWKNTEQGDTERLRLALRDYRSLLERLTGPFHGANRGVK